MKSNIMVGLAILIGLVIVVILLLPVLLDLNRYRDRYLPVLEQALHRPVDVQDVRFTLFPKLGFRVRDLTIGDDPAFSPQAFVTIPFAEVEIQWLPLLRRHIQVEHVRLHDPRVHVIRRHDGVLNMVTVGKDPALHPPEKAGSNPANALKPLFGVFAVERLSMSGGFLQYEDRAQEPFRSYYLEQLDVVTDSVQFGQTASLHVKGVVMPNQLPLEMTGRFGPLQSTFDLPMIDLAGRIGSVEGTAKGQVMDGRLELDVQIPDLSTDDMPLNIALDKPVFVKDLQAHLMASLIPNGPSKPSTGVRIDPLTVDLQTGGARIHLSGHGTPGRLILSGEAPTVSSVDFPWALSVRRPFSLEKIRFETVIQGRRVDLVFLKAQAFRGNLEAHGRWDGTPALPLLSVQGTFRNFAVESLMEALRSSSLRLSGVGELHWSLGRAAHSPSGRSTMTGPVQLMIRDGQLIGFDVMQGIEDALQLPDLLEESTGATKFSLIDANAELEGKGLAIRQLTVEAPDFSMTGVGSLAFDESLNLQGNLVVSRTIGERIIQRFPMAKVAWHQGRLVLPFTVMGTVQKPVLHFDTQSFGQQVKTNVERRIEKVLQGDEQELQQLLQDGADVLKQLFGQ
ncbi:AsmA family protein [Candidatus Nitrospira allomarina]|uniref:AsmA family protein n=1 Tax=Candidatus Nitrospira allomarina TaxID=3020900 RepID=A0AA96JSZ3_9BACT|nr:AsmA family protein [Candidatus Nitrospira allomarina]WNM58828.1 AsmA family protein [Candidatus Nitrospira allomarina]